MKIDDTVEVVGVMSSTDIREYTFAIARGAYLKCGDEPKVWFSGLAEVLKKAQGRKVLLCHFDNGLLEMKPFMDEEELLTGLTPYTAHTDELPVTIINEVQSDKDA